MITTTNTLVQKLWSYCNALRDEGMSYGDYVEQLTYLLFLKMADDAVQTHTNHQRDGVLGVMPWGHGFQ